MPGKKKWTIKVGGKTYSYTRDYKQEYRDRTPEQKHNRVLRKYARMAMEKSHGKASIKGKDVDHIHGIGGGNGKKNLRITSVKFNRARKSKRWR